MLFEDLSQKERETWRTDPDQRNEWISLWDTVFRLYHKCRQLEGECEDLRMIIHFTPVQYSEGKYKEKFGLAPPVAGEIPKEYYYLKLQPHPAKAPTSESSSKS